MIQTLPISTLFPYTTLFRSYILLAGFIITLSSCSGKKRKPSIVFMPDMYYSVAYEPFSDANFGYWPEREDRKSTRLNSSHVRISYAVFCLKKKKKKETHENT